MKRLILVVIFLLLGATFVGAANGPAILLQSRTIVPRHAVVPWSHLAAFNARHVLVQLASTPNAAERAALAAAGLELLVPIPERAWLAYVQPRNWAQVKSSSPLRYVAELESEDKIHERLAAGEIEDYALVGDGRVDLLVHFYPDASDADLEAAAEMADAEIVAPVPAIHAAFVRVNAIDDAYVLAQADAVMWVTQPSPPWGLYNDAVRPVVGAGLAHQAPYNVTGAGVNVLIYDGGIIPGKTGDAKHPDLGDRLTIGQTGVPDIIGHANHVACTVAGDGTLSGGVYAGMAPQANIISMDFTPSGLVLFYNNPGDIDTSYGHAINDFGAQTANNSIGANIGPNGYNCAWEGDYEGSAALIDEIIGGKFGRQMIIVWAAGNERTSGCPGDFRLIPPPVPAKNTITVGATDVTNNKIAYFSSRGPTDDGRLKPDVVAPGHQTGAGFANTGTKSCTAVLAPGYMNMSGTSQACPVVVGATALALEEWAAVVGGDDPTPSLMKALIIHGVQDLGTPGPDYTFGYGLVQIPASLDLILNQSFLQFSLDQGETWRQKFRRTTGPVKATLVWTDPPGPILAQRELVNDLDLSLSGEDKTVYLPWTLDPAHPALAATTGADHINPVEQVFIDTPTDNVFEIVVQATDVPLGPQAASLVITGLETCDADGDGFDATACGGDDCRDSDAEVNPDADEICDDGIDNNCDGDTDAADPACAATDDDATDDDASGDDDQSGDDDDDDSGGCF